MAIDQKTESRTGAVGPDAHGITAEGTVWWNLSSAALYEHALAAGDGSIAEGGPLVVSTGSHTGRSPKDKFIVREPGSEDRVWWGAINQPIDPANHASLGSRLREHLGRNDIYVIDAYAGADPKEQLSVRLVHRERLARAVRPDPLHRAARRRDRAARARRRSSSTRRASRPTRPATASAPATSSACTSPTRRS